MTPIASGRIVLWEGASLWLLQVAEHPSTDRTDFHAHHALQVTLALDDSFELYGPKGRVDGPAAVVAADARHAFAARGAVALLFIDPHSRAGEALSRSRFDEAPIVPLRLEDFGDLPARLLAELRALQRNDEVVRDLGRALVDVLSGEASVACPDPRVRQTIAWASEALDRPLRIADAAKLAGLSTDRMSHLFVEQTGLPFRTYLLWMRLSKAVEFYAAGLPLTGAAHEAGFADSAHFSRTFRRMFGVAAAALKMA